MRGFDHERLAAYGLALDFTEYSEKAIGAAKPGRRYLADQLRRAASSVALNIAEGGQEYSPGEKAHFYRIAARSAAECAAALDVYVRVRALAPGQVEPGKGMLRQIVALLVALCRRLEKQAGDDKEG